MLDKPWKKMLGDGRIQRCLREVESPVLTFLVEFASRLGGPQRLLVVVVQRRQRRGGSHHSLAASRCCHAVGKKGGQLVPILHSWLDLWHKCPN